jgi:hypothetical protein
MNDKEWVAYVNQHMNPDSDLPRLKLESLERWSRLGLLVPTTGEYRPTDLERTLALLMLERVINRMPNRETR